MMDLIRLKSPTIAIRVSDRQAVTVSQGGVVTLREEPALESRGDSEMVDVEWDGTQIQMFARDIRDRGTKVRRITA